MYNVGLLIALHKSNGCNYHVRVREGSSVHW